MVKPLIAALLGLFAPLALHHGTAGPTHPIQAPSFRVPQVAAETAAVDATQQCPAPKDDAGTESDSCRPGCLYTVEEGTGGATIEAVAAPQYPMGAVRYRSLSGEMSEPMACGGGTQINSASPVPSSLPTNAVGEALKPEAISPAPSFPATPQSSNTASPLDETPIDQPTVPSDPSNNSQYESQLQLNAGLQNTVQMEETPQDPTDYFRQNETSVNFPASPPPAPSSFSSGPEDQVLNSGSLPDRPVNFLPAAPSEVTSALNITPIPLATFQPGPAQQTGDIVLPPDDTTLLDQLTYKSAWNWQALILAEP